MTYSAEPGHIKSFRDATDNHEKMRGWKMGFCCADCHTKKTEKSAAVSADMETAASSVR